MVTQIQTPVWIYVLQLLISMLTTAQDYAWLIVPSASQRLEMCWLVVVCWPALYQNSPMLTTTLENVSLTVHTIQLWMLLLMLIILLWPV